MHHIFHIADEIWKTDLDFLVPHNDRLIVQSVMNVSSQITEETLPLPSALRIPEATTKDPTTYLPHSQRTQTKSKHKQNAGKSMYVVTESKISYDTTKWDASGGTGGNSLNGSPEGGTRKVSSPAENVHLHPHLPEVSDWSPLSPELLNYTIALLVFAIRCLCLN